MLRARVPGLQVRTPGDRVPNRVSMASDATLDFAADCRCNEAGTPNGFYVREAFLYQNRDEPARVLFHWTDAGEPSWKKQVRPECIGQTPLSHACKASFEEADIAFAAALASALLERQSAR
jgi:hypothetical protein